MACLLSNNHIKITGMGQLLLKLSDFTGAMLSVPYLLSPVYVCHKSNFY